VPWLLLAAVAGLAFGAIAVYLAVHVWWVSSPVTAIAASKPDFSGSATCAACHAREHSKWSGSQHAAAMLMADGNSVLGNFADARFTYAGITSVFSTREGRYFVRTDGPDGKIDEFEVKYTFGVEPLQQYLIELPGGRLQALGVAWDTRPKQAGGQRWFHLYPGRRLAAGDPLHWTGIDQNWNYQCADCHSTNLRKNYDAHSGTYKTTWSEITVGCEGCHGPGSEHLSWARRDSSQQARDTTKGLTAALEERKGVQWTMDQQTGNATRSWPRESDREIEICARCHGRRGQFSDAHVAGQAFHDAFRPALLEPGLYYPDGQQRDEVYNYASFLQSRMHSKGVTCSDCHDPHTQKLRAPGNAVCAQCHLPARYDTSAHHHHPSGSPGTQCASCHMPTTTYMIVDPRHDHSMRVPRPDRTVTLGVPNACNQCHTKRSPQWASDSIRSWFPNSKPGFQAFAEALHAGDQRAPGARSALLAVIEDKAQPGIARASALTRMAGQLTPDTLPFIAGALNDHDASVRMAAVSALSQAESETRLRYLPRMLTDAARVVRMDAARALAGGPERELAAGDRGAFDRAIAEYVSAQEYNADRPEAHAALGNLHATRGRYDDAVAAFRTALRLDPTFAQAAVNLADLYRARGMETQVQAVLREALEADPGSATARHALGLALIRQKRTRDGIAALGEAARLAPEDARLAYVFAVALHDTGKPDEAMRVLETTLKRHPYDRDVLIALGMYEREAGRHGSARKRARLLRELEPADQELARIAEQIEQAGSGR
jgi:Flp pilus assembly protein TadD